ncbi:ABC-2 transporter permease [Jeotgalibacillus sp. ET6]|uniref:ABC-2 transporter permease n=1 Tax=Jeotgalibacillus sp. ET6 TaxID=3037260 RepID=UPI0024181901|nr:ABC-2 transporter permease [Jeotgalibacillus sp. ET6]MDG5472447.1 ABC-2 transporter permease [Jeotgalibacillus sp. ET6]
MLNLIRRDVILQKKLILVFIPFILFFTLMEVHPILTFFVASVYVPFNAYAYDEKSDVNILLNSLPYTRKEIIAARYLGALFYMAAAIGLSIIAMLLFSKDFSVVDVGMGAGAFLLFGAITFPLFYILKQGYITATLMFVIIIGALMGPFLVRVLGDHLPAIAQFFTETSETVLYSGAAIIAIVFYTVSWGFTTLIYQRKAF